MEAPDAVVLIVYYNTNQLIFRERVYTLIRKISRGKVATYGQVAKLTGTFLTKIFEGPYQNVGKWVVGITDCVLVLDDGFDYQECWHSQ